MDYLFVYGTLRNGINHRNGQLLLEQTQYLGTATVSARLYDIGRYPGLVLAAGSGLQVHGDVFSLHHPERLLRILDEYEECSPGFSRPQEYRRIRTRARLKQGGSITAWVYEYRHPVRNRKRIIQGDYLRYTGRDMSDISLERGKSTGFDSQ
jgi:gamma-glutamylcyclotransferase (GGCT)/AIG2-like uncharacterized protein YtfP